MSLSAYHPSGEIAPRTLRVPNRARAMRRDIWRGLLPLAVAALALPLLLRADGGHVILATLLGSVLVGTALYSRRSGLVATLVFLLFLGDYRRFVGLLAGYTPNDPLLLVAPAAVAALFCCALFEQRLSLRGPLAKLVAALMLLMVLGMFNPLQGGLDVGFAGALFYLVPLLWFWIGRAYVTRELLEHLSLRVLLTIGLLATAWGLYQNYFGLLPFEQVWVEQGGYGALYLSDEVIRAIGFFNSSAEYQRFLLVTATTLLAAWLTRRSKLVLALPIVLVVLFLAAARGPIVMFASAAVVLWAIGARRTIAWPARFVVAAGVLGAALVGALLFLQTVPFAQRVDVVVERQVGGLLDPANEKTSTATGHLKMIADGIVAGVTTPAGQGLGSTTLAGSKFGEQTVNAEVDFANIMLSLGVLGGLLYAAIIVTVLRTAFAWWRTQRETVALATVGVVVVTFGGWLIGSEYSMAALVWLYIGAMDRLAWEARRKQQKEPRRAHRPRYA